MTRLLSAAHLTTIDLAPPAFIEAAAVAGFDAVGLRLLRVTPQTPGYALMNDPAAMRATKTALALTGLFVHDIEFVKITPDFDLEPLSSFLDAGAELGARHVITSPYDPDLSRLTETLAALAETASARGLGVVLEFFPWTVVPDLSTALSVTDGTGAGVLVDSLHFDRSGSTLERLAATDSARLPFAHLCDAQVLGTYAEADLLHSAREERLPPGKGQIDLAGFLAALPDNLPLGLEVPMTALAQSEGSQAVLKRVHSAAADLLGIRRR